MAEPDPPKDDDAKDDDAKDDDAKDDDAKDDDAKDDDAKDDDAKDDIDDVPTGGDARSVLERELYWAGDPSTPASESTRQLRIALHDFAAARLCFHRSRYPINGSVAGPASILESTQTSSRTAGGSRSWLTRSLRVAVRARRPRDPVIAKRERIDA